VIEPAPGELELVRKFVNTYDVEEAKDELATPDSLAAWIRGHGLGPTGRLEEADRRRAIALREALRALLLANTGDPLDPRALRTLNGEAATLRLALRFDSDHEAELMPAGDGIERALAAVLVIVQRAMADGSWRRLKVCREDTCQWAFFDQSKNRSGRWCDMAVCGNRHKVREYRRRTRHAGGRSRAGTKKS
jgi:predicted RNA-binding Zn ribbon-like protein